MQETIDGYEGRIQIGGRKLSNPHYADDNFVSRFKGRVTRVGKLNGLHQLQMGLHINADKTKVMVTNGTICSIKLQNIVLEQVDTLPYFGALITSDTICTKEIHSRFAKGQHVITSLRNI